jgi:lipopolysaccharide biosynthesis glycosyltransferase
MDPIRVFVGTEPRQYVPQLVLADSIRRNTTSPVDIRFCTQDQKRIGGTKFGFVRYMVPSYCDFRGKAIYLDADMVVLRDIKELWSSLPDDASLNVVHQPEGFYDGKPAEPDNYTSVMVLRCDRLRTWDPVTLFNNVVPNKQAVKDGEIRYRDFMTLRWFDASQIAPLDPRWNHLNIVRHDTCLIHFTHAR